MKISIKINKDYWTKQLEGLAPQFKDAVVKSVDAAVSRGVTKLETDITTLTGGLKSTIQSGASYKSNVKVNGSKTIKDAYVGYIAMGDDKNPAGNIEWGHETPRVGAPNAHKTRALRVFYPMVIYANKLRKSTQSRLYSNIIRKWRSGG